MRKRHGINVMAIKRGEDVVVSPGAEDLIKKGDILVVVGQNKDIEKLEKFV
ncbi:MAG: TrkA C-terminal domain-containing protein [Bacillota bacterium]